MPFGIVPLSKPQKEEKKGKAAIDLFPDEKPGPVSAPGSYCNVLKDFWQRFLMDSFKSLSRGSFKSFCKHSLRVPLWVPLRVYPGVPVRISTRVLGFGGFGVDGLGRLAGLVWSYGFGI